VIDVSASGESADRVVDAGRRIDDQVVGSEIELVDANPILRTMAEIAREYGVSVTLSVYPADAEENELVDELGNEIGDDGE
jgi:hypothetical protein